MTCRFCCISSTCSPSVRRLPSREAALRLLHQLRGCAHTVEQLLPAIRHAAGQLLAQLAHSFFMPLCLTCLASLARVQVIVCSISLPR